MCRHVHPAFRMRTQHHAMDSPSSAMSSPTKALNPLSPERINQQIAPNTPSLTSEYLNMHRKTPKGLSDVQSRVAFLNNLSRGNSPAHGQQQSASSSAAVQRAILGREEAESALTKVSDELSEAQSRERRISERLESLLEELQSTKERQAHERTLFEKEIRKARKEAFRAGSVLVKTQEELKHARTEAKGFKDEALVERTAKEQAKQEAFERAYALAGLTEETEILKEQLRAAEASLHSKKLEARTQQLQRNNVGRMSIAEGDLNLLLTPAGRRPKRSAEDLVNSPKVNSPLANAPEPSPAQDTPPKRQRLSEVTPLEDNQEALTPLMQEALISELEQDLMFERRLRIDAENMLEFMRVECHFKRCSCRMAEDDDAGHVHQQQSVKTVEDAPQAPGADKAQEPQAAKATEKVPEARGTDQVQEPPSMDTADKQEQEKEQSAATNDKNQLLVDLDETSPSHTPKGEPVPFPMESDEERLDADLDDDVDEIVEEVEEVQEVDDDDDDDDEPEPLITFSPATGTFHTMPSPVRSPRKHAAVLDPIQSPRDHAESGMNARLMSGSPPKYASHRHQTPFDSIMESEAYVSTTPGTQPSPALVDVPWDPVLPVRHNTATPEERHDPIKIPLQTDESASNPFAEVPGTPVSREAALAQIRARRGRTNTMKRSASASESVLRSGGMGVTPVRSARRIPGVVQNSETRSDGSVRNRRDVSAPIRMFHH
ncbi:hypothetical protein BO71DRAFT_408562 [Aspergillus ellipticus CBS 707.79]|uniref:Uncharacterized protein n=1 Tax=Aspergillus ellipticus CBS 707.79 TaxID=1448320 RepID=A0A319DDF3_9EURO|nr:hypothetical protein BO71DRAFT_408562 [Aspergillus ellipticus CBS 707.79]